LEKGETPNTPAVSLLYALAVQLDRIRAETMEARWARHEAVARRTWEGVGEMRGRGIELSLLAPEGYRWRTVATLRPPAGWPGPKLAAALRERAYVVATGSGKRKEETSRTGHMGDHTVAELEELLGVIEEVLVL